MQDGKHVILCVDDDADIRFCLKKIIETNGYVFAEASSAEEGLGTYKTVKPDLVIVDLMMEEVDAGVNFVKELKLLGNTAPVYMLSSVGDNLTTTVDFAELGLSGVMQKPVDSDNLLAILNAKL